MPPDRNIRLPLREYEMLNTLTGGEYNCNEVRGFIIDAYRSARNKARANAVEFLRRAAYRPLEARVVCACPDAEAWDTIRAVAAGGDLGAIRTPLRLQCLGWYAVLPAALTFMDAPPIIADAKAASYSPKSNR